MDKKVVLGIVDHTLLGVTSTWEDMRQILDDAGLDTTGLLTDENAPTSFTDVMSVTGGQRTFFTYSGASAKFGTEDVDFGENLPEILHLGYFLLFQKV